MNYLAAFVLRLAVTACGHLRPGVYEPFIGAATDLLAAADAYEGK